MNGFMVESIYFVDPVVSTVLFLNLFLSFFIVESFSSNTYPSSYLQSHQVDATRSDATSLSTGYRKPIVILLNNLHPECAAPKHWSKYTTPLPWLEVLLWSGHISMPGSG